MKKVSGGLGRVGEGIGGGRGSIREGVGLGTW